MAKSLTEYSDKKALRKFFIFTIGMLILAHGAYNTLISNVGVNVVFLVIILFLIFRRNFTKKSDFFGYVLIMYVISHFDIMNKYGGLVPLMSFGIFFLILATKKRVWQIKRKYNSFDFILIVFIAANLLGILLRPQMGVVMVGNALIVFFGYILMFLITRRVLLKENHIRIIVYVIAIMAMYESLVALNTYIGVFHTGKLIFFPAESRFGGHFAEATFNHSELFGEWSMMSILFIFPLVISKRNYVDKKFLIIGFFASILNLFLSGSRSTFVLALVGLVLIYLISISLNNVRMLSLYKGIKYSAFVLIVILLLWIPLGLGYVIERFGNETNKGTQIQTEALSLKSFVTGEGTPREGAFSFFLDRYNQQEPSYWYIGYGFGTPEYNRAAWFGSADVQRSDYHSLYLSLVITYGYIGGIAYLMIILYTIRELYLTLKLTKRFSFLNFYYYPVLGFMLMFAFLFLNEYKISLLRIATYHMLTWMWLGFSHAIIASVKIRLDENRLAGAVPH